MNSTLAMDILNEYNSIKELKEDTKDYKKVMNFYYDSLKINNNDYDKLAEILAYGYMLKKE